MKAQPSFQAEIVGQTRKDADRALTVTRAGRYVRLWSETEDGEAEIGMSRQHFEDFVKRTRELMNWPQQE